MNPQKNESPTMASGTGAELVCNPWTEVPTPPDRFQFVMPASRYYANGGTAFDHIYAGVDGFSLISIPNPRPKWEGTYRVDLYHTKDWVIYHIPIGRRTHAIEVSVCAKNPYTPKIGTPAEVFLKEGAPLPPIHDADLAAAGWRNLGTFTILPAERDWKVYKFKITPPSVSDSFSVGVSLKEGEIGPEDPTTPYREDRNLYLAWVKITVD